MANKKNIFSNLRTATYYFAGLSEVEPFRLETLSILKKFIYGGSYTKYQNRDRFLELEPLDDTKIARQLAISVAGVRQARKRISEEAYKLLGDDIVDRVMFGSQHECDLIRDNISILEFVLSDKEYIFSDIKDRLNDSYIGTGDSVFPLSACKHELLFLSLFSINRFGWFLDRLDFEKINYLLRLLDNKVDNVSDRMIALKFVNSTTNTEGLAKMLRDLSVPTE